MEGVRRRPGAVKLPSSPAARRALSPLTNSPRVNLSQKEVASPANRDSSPRAFESSPVADPSASPIPHPISSPKTPSCEPAPAWVANKKARSAGPEPQRLSRPATLSEPRETLYPDESPTRRYGELQALRAQYRTKVEDAYALVKRLCEVTTTADRKEQRKPADENPHGRVQAALSKLDAELESVARDRDRLVKENAALAARLSGASARSSSTVRRPPRSPLGATATARSPATPRAATGVSLCDNPLFGASSATPQFDTAGAGPNLFPSPLGFPMGLTPPPAPLGDANTDGVEAPEGLSWAAPDASVEVERWRSEAETAHRELDAAREKQASLEAQVEGLQGHVDNREQMIATLEKNLSEKSHLIEAMQAQSKHQQQAINRLKQTLERERSEAEHNIREALSLAEAAEGAHGKQLVYIEVLEDRLGQVEDERDSATRQLERAVFHTIEMRREVDGLRAALAHSIARAACEAAVLRADAPLEDQSAGFVSPGAMSPQAAAEESARAATQQLEDAKAKMAALEAELAAARLELASEGVKRSAAEDAAIEAGRRAAEAEDKAREAEIRLAALQEELTAKERELAEATGPELERCESPVLEPEPGSRSPVRIARREAVRASGEVDPVSRRFVSHEGDALQTPADADGWEAGLELSGVMSSGGLGATIDSGPRTVIESWGHGWGLGVSGDALGAERNSTAGRLEEAERATEALRSQLEEAERRSRALELRAEEAEARAATEAAELQRRVADLEREMSAAKELLAPAPPIPATPARAPGASSPDALGGRSDAPTERGEDGEDVPLLSTPGSEGRTKGSSSPGSLLPRLAGLLTSVRTPVARAAETFSTLLSPASSRGGHSPGSPDMDCAKKHIRALTEALSAKEAVLQEAMQRLREVEAQSDKGGMGVDLLGIDLSGGDVAEAANGWAGGVVEDELERMRAEAEERARELEEIRAALEAVEGEAQRAKAEAEERGREREEAEGRASAAEREWHAAVDELAQAREQLEEAREAARLALERREAETGALREAARALEGGCEELRRVLAERERELGEARAAIETAEEEARGRAESEEAREREVEELRGLLQAREREVEELREKAEESSKEAGSLREQVASMEARIDELMQEQSAIRSAEARRLAAELAHASDRNRELEARCAELDAMTLIVARLTARAESLEAELAGARGRCASLEATLREESGKRGGLEEAVAGAEARVEEWAREARAAVAELQRERERREEAGSRAGQAERMGEAAERELRRERGARESVEGEVCDCVVDMLVADLESDAERSRLAGRMDEERLELGLELSEVRKKSTGLEWTIVRLKSDKEEVEIYTGRLERTVAELESDKGQLETTVAELETTVAELESGNKKLESDKGQLETTVAELEDTIKRLEVRSDELSALVIEADNRAEASHVAIIARSHEIKELKASMEKTEEEHRDELEKILTDIQALKEELQFVREEREAEICKRQTLQEVVEEKQGELRDATQQVESLRATVEEREGELRDATQQVESLRATVEEREGELCAAKDAVGKLAVDLQKASEDRLLLEARVTEECARADHAEVRARDAEARAEEERSAKEEAEMKLREAERSLTHAERKAEGAEMREADARRSLKALEESIGRGEAAEEALRAAKAEIEDLRRRFTAADTEATELAAKVLRGQLEARLAEQDAEYARREANKSQRRLEAAQTLQAAEGAALAGRMAAQWCRVAAAKADARAARGVAKDARARMRSAQGIALAEASAEAASASRAVALGAVASALSHECSSLTSHLRVAATEAAVLGGAAIGLRESCMALSRTVEDAKAEVHRAREELASERGARGREVEELRKAVGLLEVELSLAREDRVAGKALAKELTGQLGVLEGALEESERGREAAEAAVEGVREEMERAVRAKEAEIEGVREEMERALEGLRNAECATQDAREVSSSARNELEKMRAEFALAEKNAADLHERLSATYGELEDAKQRCREAEEMLERALEEKERVKVQAGELLSVVGRLKDQARDVELDKETLLEMVEDGRKEKERLAGEVEEERKKKAEAETRVAEIEKEIEDLQKKAEKAEGEAEELRSRVEKAEGEAEELRSRVESAEGTAAQLKGLAERAENELRESMDQTAALEKTVSDLRAEVATLQGEVERVNGMRAVSEGAIQALREEAAKARAEAAASVEVARAATASVEDARREANELRRRAEVAMSEAGEARKEAGRERERVEEVLEAHRELEERCAEAERERARLESEVAAVRRRMETALETLGGDVAGAGRGAGAAASLEEIEERLGAAEREAGEALERGRQAERMLRDEESLRRWAEEAKRELEERVREAESGRERAEERAEEMRERAREAERRARDAEALSGDISDAKRELGRRMEEATEEAARLRGALAAARSDVASAEMKVEELEGRIVALRSQLAASEGRAQEGVRELSSAHSLLGQTQALLDGKNAELNQLRGELEALRAAAKVAGEREREAQAWREEVATLGADLARAAEVVEELDRERARATARINGLKEALGTAKARETKTALQLAIKEQESREARDQLAGALGKLREVAEQPGWRQSPSGKMRFSPGKAGKAIRDERDGLQATLDGVRDALHELSRERATLCRTLHQCGLEVHTVGASGSNLVDSVQGLLTELATLQERVQAAGKFAGDALADVEAATSECEHSVRVLSTPRSGPPSTRVPGSAFSTGGVTGSSGASSAGMRRVLLNSTCEPGREPSTPATPAPRPAIGVDGERDEGMRSQSGMTSPEECDSPMLCWAETPVRDTFDEEAEAVLRSSQALLSRLGTVRQSICQLQGHLTPTGPDWAAAASRLRESVDLSVHNPPLEAGGDGKQAEPSTPPKSIWKKIWSGGSKKGRSKEGHSRSPKTPKSNGSTPGSRIARSMDQAWMQH